MFVFLSSTFTQDVESPWMAIISEYIKACDCFQSKVHLDQQLQVEKVFTGSGILLKHSVDYSHRGGQRSLKEHYKYNEEEANTEVLTIYHEGEVRVNVIMTSTYQMAKRVQVSNLALKFCRLVPRPSTIPRARYLLPGTPGPHVRACESFGGKNTNSGTRKARRLKFYVYVSHPNRT
ncbi:unnamed protein product [Gongylonema pulchrum]|uniref:Metalloprotease n=1 Tax=Gongylonema pulchrum TaxID=637853 RepID=A0A183ES66_9BILA|nr:unnamed protein product [Gongylonema pulchrum]